jgi:hypothetical protein
MIFAEFPRLAEPKARACAKKHRRHGDEGSHAYDRSE